MGQKTKIGWTDTTWSPLRAKVKMDAAKIARRKGYTSLVNIAEKMAGRVGPHCEHVSEGCKHCYSETGNHRCLPANGTGLPFDRRSRDLIDSIVDEKILMQPLRWKRGRRIFVENQSDLFGEWVTDEAIDRVFAVMALCPQHTFQILTKRPERMRAWFSDTRHDGVINAMRAMGIDVAALRWPLPNIHLGVSVENQATADARIPLLLQTPAAKRFVSYEPALGEISWRWAAWDDDSPNSRRLVQLPDVIRGGRRLAGSIDHLDGLRMLDWLIIGGESGPGARPFDIQWARNTIKQCKAAGVACFVKQVGTFCVSANRKDWTGKQGGVEPTGIGLEERWRIRFADRSGSDPLEWPEDLRVQELIPA